MLTLSPEEHLNTTITALPLTGFCLLCKLIFTSPKAAARLFSPVSLRHKRKYAYCNDEDKQ